MLDENRELVAAETADDSIVEHIFGFPRAEGEYIVAGRVSKAVIELLEMVNIENHKSDIAVSRVFSDRPFER